MQLLEWSTFKAIAQARYLSIQWVETSREYNLTIADGPIKYNCTLNRYPTDTTDLLDFETNFKTIGNQSFSDVDGVPFMRLKAAKKGWTVWVVPIEITTSTLLGSLFSKTALGVNIPGISCKIYDNSDNEITTAGLLNANLATCTKTVIDFEPSFDYEMIGGSIRTLSNPGVDTRLWIVSAPDIAEGLGGSKELASGVNLKYLSPSASIEVDGRVAKYIPYNASTHSGKMRFILKHPAGTTVNLQILIHTYRA